MMRSVYLSAVTQDGGTVGNEQEVEGDGNNNELHWCGGAGVGGVPTEVQFSGTGSVEVGAWLVATWVDCEVDHHCAGIIWGDDVWTTIVEWLVGIEEGFWESVVDLDSVGREGHVGASWTVD